MHARDQLLRQADRDHARTMEALERKHAPRLKSVLEEWAGARTAACHQHQARRAAIEDGAVA